MSNKDHAHHITPWPTLAKNLAWLMLLMVLTIAFARADIFEGLSTVANNFIAMTIAVIKACLVIAIFMGVKYSTKLTKLFAIGGFVWLILIFGILIDYASRHWEPVTGWEPDTPSSSLPRSLTREE